MLCSAVAANMRQTAEDMDLSREFIAWLAFVEDTMFSGLMTYPSQIHVA